MNLAQDCVLVLLDYSHVGRGNTVCICENVLLCDENTCAAVVKPAILAGAECSHPGVCAKSRQRVLRLGGVLGMGKGLNKLRSNVFPVISNSV